MACFFSFFFFFPCFVKGKKCLHGADCFSISQNSEDPATCPKAESEGCHSIEFDMLRLRSFPNLEDHPLLAVRECL